MVHCDSQTAAGNWYLRSLIIISLAFSLPHYCTQDNYNSPLSVETDIKGPDKEYLWWEL